MAITRWGYLGHSGVDLHELERDYKRDVLDAFDSDNWMSAGNDLEK